MENKVGIIAELNVALPFVKWSIVNYPSTNINIGDYVVIARIKNIDFESSYRTYLHSDDLIGDIIWNTRINFAEHYFDVTWFDISDNEATLATNAMIVRGEFW